MNVILIIGAIIIVSVIFVVIIYNSLIVALKRTEEGWADIEVQLKRRYDLIPNLVDTVKGYAKHESSVFEKVTQLRAEAINAGSLGEQGQKENMLTDALKSLFAVSENYPDLKASTNFVELQRELADTENKIQAARRFYNSTVLEYNTALEVFPKNLVAAMFSKFKQSVFFELDDSEREKAEKAPEVKF